MIRRKIRKLVATLAVVVLPVFVAVPLGDCGGQLDIVVQAPGDYGAIPINIP